MFRSSHFVPRAATALLLAASLLGGVACKKQQATNPLAHLNSKQPDRVLFDRAQEAMKEKKYEVARTTLQTLISAYPDSEYVAQAKLAIGDSWYQDGTTAGLTQAETEYRDFITFFPNMPEAATAQLKIAEIHYKQMGKPDRDYTHARRAQEEYRQLLLQYPDSKLADEARQRLLEVQEVLAERQYRIAHFYFQRGAMMAAIARFKTLTDTYPLYSQADDALFMLGQAYELQADRTRASNAPEAVKQRLAKDYLDKAAEAYSRIAERYPAMPRYRDAAQRLEALKRPVPKATPEVLEQNKKELASRRTNTRYERFVNDMGKSPDLSQASHTGQPIMTDPEETDAPQLVREINSVISNGTEAKSGAAAVAIKPVSASDAPAGESSSASTQAPRSAAAVNPSDVPAEPPSQMNESAPSAESAANTSSSSSTAANTKDDPKDASSSNHKASKKKHHFHIPLPL